jgi:hypothetical protein
MLYVGIYFAMALIAFGLRNKPAHGQRLYPIAFVLLFLFCAFRFEVGCDWLGYRNQFYRWELFELVDEGSRYRDPLWWMLIGNLNRAGLNFTWLNVVAAMIFFAGLHVLARRQRDRLGFLVMLFPILLLQMGMSGIRQAAAIGIICIAFAAFVDRRLIRFVLLVVLASAIHSSAMVFLLLAPLVNGEYTRGRVALAVLLALPGLLFLTSSAAVDVAMTRYVDTDIDAAGAGFRVGLLALTGLAFFFVLRRHWLASGSPHYKLVSIGSLSMVALAALLPLSTVIADRLGYYLIPVQAMILARISSLPLGRPRALYALTAYGAFGITLLVWVSLSSHYQRCYVPYQTWLVVEPVSRYGF